MFKHKITVKIKGEFIDIYSQDGKTWYDNKANRIDNNDVEQRFDIWPLIYIATFIVILIDWLLYYASTVN